MLSSAQKIKGRDTKLAGFVFHEFSWQPISQRFRAAGSNMPVRRPGTKRVELQSQSQRLGEPGNHWHLSAFNHVQPRTV